MNKLVLILNILVLLTFSGRIQADALVGMSAIQRYNKSISTTKASWYSEESCRREGTSGVMANGRKFKSKELTAASWDYPFGTRILVTNERNNRSVIVTITDRGPNKKLYKAGRKIDLSEGAFSKIANLREGVITVSVEKL